MMLVLSSALLVCASPGESVDLSALPLLEEAALLPVEVDWLVRPVERRAGAYRSADGRELVLDNGLVRRRWRVAPDGACVELTERTGGAAILRAVQPEARVTIDGRAFDVGGLVGQPNHAFLTEGWLDAMPASPDALHLVAVATGPIRERFGWKRVRHCAPDAVWPPPGIELRMDYAAPERLPGVRVSVHYELYDGLPVMSKWLVVHNEGESPITVDRFTSELLALVEHSNYVEAREGVAQPRPDSLHVETDFAFGGFTPENANRHVVHWREDPDYATQVNYLRRTPCLLVIEPTRGPAQDVAPGASFESYRTFELVFDSTDRERRGLARRRMMRAVAPWTTENPLMMHMRTAEPAAVRGAIDQCAAVGFELLILSFGSGFDIENEDPAYIAQWREISEYARAKGVEIGGYSLLSSRRIGGGNDVVSPEGEPPTHGNCPALTSEWGQDYYRKLRAFFEQTGFTLLEHDGPYPGDIDVTPRPPLQKGAEDSRWVQWRIAAGFYEWCRERGIYVNAPDHYFLNGTSKCGMGYRETNWSLPRAQQVIHTRQNIYDGTWRVTPSMGWMFVPLTQYHGGGAAATIEPLDEHRDHYRRMLESNLGLGVQACYRGPRLYDTEATRQLVAAQVAWFKRYRDILESDLVHGRRADGRDLDWMLHVNPRLDEKGMLVVYNPLEETIERTLRVDLYYTGLTELARVSHEGGVPFAYPLDREYAIELPVRVPAGGMSWYVIR